jgi:hypothetical protein
MWYVVNQKQGVSALGLQRVLGFGSYQTAWTWLHKLRRAMVLPGRESLAGAVEVDETLVGGVKPGKPGRSADGKALVVIAAECHDGDPGRARMRRIPNASADDPAHVVMPNVHRIASLLKRWLLGTHQGAVSEAQLDYYLDEFTFRFNRRGSRHRGLLFYRLIEGALAAGPHPYKDLRSRRPSA